MRRSNAPEPEVREWRRETRPVMRSSWPSSDSPVDFPEDELLQLRRLAASLILSAIQCSADPKHLKWLYPAAGAKLIARYRARDREWIESNRRRCRLRVYRMSTFIECCEVLELDPEVMREAIRARGWLDGSKRFDVKKIADVLAPVVAHG